MILCFIDPSSGAFDEDRFFDLTNPLLNRDDGLLPFYNLKKELEALGYTVTTFDRHLKYEKAQLVGALYISFSRTRNMETLQGFGLRLLAYFLLEPPLVDEKMYESLSLFTENFENVFVHNTHGDCYDLKNADTSRLRKLYWPQPHAHVSKPFWENRERMNKVVVINGHHKPQSFPGRELYSQRIKWAVDLNKYIPVDLFGRGWMKKITRSNLWLVYIFNYFKIKQIYQGPCQSKIEVMSKYKFSLCFENLVMDGYITEKIFDCFYAGTIPIYWGGSDIEKWIPENCYIDMRKFSSAKELSIHLGAISNEDLNHLRENGKKFLESEQGQPYFNIFTSLKKYL